MKNFLIQKINRIKFLIIVFLFFSFSGISFAGEVFFDGKREVFLGEEFIVLIKVKTDKIPVNSAEMVVSFDNQKLEFVGYEENNSIIKFWLDSPKAEGDKIKFTGIVFGGVSETFEAGKNSFDEISLVSLKFKTKKEGNAIFSFGSSVVLQNDGLGSPFVHTNKDFYLNINKKNISLDEEKINISIDAETPKDTTPPENFEVIFVKNSLLGKTPDMLVFNANDKDSGIKEYKIKKSFAGWVNIQNPHPVAKNIFSKKVLVRAYDFSGNYQEANVLIPGFVPFQYILILFAVLVALFCGYKLLK